MSEALDAAAREMFGNATPDTVEEAERQLRRATAVIRAYLDTLDANEIDHYAQMTTYDPPASVYIELIRP